MTETRALILLKDDFLRVLSEAQELRSEKLQQIGNEPEWVIYERKVMLEAVNAVRLQKDLLPVTAREVRQAENCAVGHVDYGQKFALYCAELASR